MDYKDGGWINYELFNPGEKNNIFNLFSNPSGSGGINIHM